MPIRCIGAGTGPHLSSGCLVTRSARCACKRGLPRGISTYGFIEGQNLAVEWRAFGQDLNLISQFAAELVSAGVDVITTAGEEATRAAQQATKTIPIVAIADDLLGAGLVQSLARPEGNTTGVSVLAVDLDGKR